MADPQKSYDALISTLKQISLLSSINAVLGWDERVYLPAAGAELRADQQSMLARMTHEQFTSPKIGDLLKQIESSETVKDPDSNESANIRDSTHQPIRRLRFSEFDWRALISTPLDSPDNGQKDGPRDD